MGEGSSKPISSIAFPTSFDRLKSENCIREFISHHHLVCELIRSRTETETEYTNRTPDFLDRKTNIQYRYTMKVVAFSGSARKDANTAILVETVFDELKKAGLKTELVQLAGKKSGVAPPA